MYRYRNEYHTTRGASKNFFRINRLGRILRVKGYRFTSSRRYDQGYSVRREYVLVVGEKGTARFSGLCWGFSGEGPRGLTDLLINVGAPGWIAENLPRWIHRGNEDGTDWELKFDGGKVEVNFLPWGQAA